MNIGVPEYSPLRDFAEGCKRLHASEDEDEDGWTKRERVRRREREGDKLSMLNNAIKGKKSDLDYSQLSAEFHLVFRVLYHL